jgi:hypothetical protein
MHSSRFQEKLEQNECIERFTKNRKYFYYADSFEAVFTYKIRRNDVGIIINNAVAVNPKILTSINFFL